MFKFVVFSALLALAYAQTPFHTCDSGLPLPDNFELTGCTAEPCPLPQGSTLSMNVTMTAAKDLEAMHGSVVAYALGVSTPYPLPEPDVCVGLIDTACPVVEGEQFVWHAEMELLEVFPEIPLTLEFTVHEHGEDGEGLYCFKFDAEVVSGNKKL